MKNTLISDCLTDLSTPQAGVTELESGAAQRIEMRNAIAQLWGMFPNAKTLADLETEIRNVVAIGDAITAMTKEGLSAHQTRARLVAKGLLK
jgi:hypothetical protein